MSYCIAVETDNSLWIIDRDKRKYFRLPKAGRMHPVEAVTMLYSEWLPLKDVPKPYRLIVEDGHKCLNVIHADSTHGVITSPVLRIMRWRLPNADI